MDVARMLMTVLGGGTPWLLDEQVLALPSLVGYWPGEELSGATLVDASGNGKTGAYYGAPAVTLNQPGIGDGQPSVYYPGAGGAAFTAALTNLTPELFTLLQYVYIDPTAASDDIYHWSAFCQIDGNNIINLYKDNGSNGNSFRASYTAGGTGSISILHHYDAPRWMLTALTVNKAQDRMRWILDGIQQGPDIAGLGTWAGTPSNLYIGSAGGNNWQGWIAKTAVINAELSPQTLYALSGRGRSASSTVNNILYLGDSKTASYDTQWMIQAELQRRSGQIWRETPRKVAVGGITTAAMLAQAPADIAAMAGKGTPDRIIYNLGANDCLAGIWTTKADWKANTLSLVNLYAAAYPSALHHLTKVWRNDAAHPEALTNIALMNAAVDELYASYPALFRPWINEANYLPGSDNGATYTADQIHPNAAGYALLAPAQAQAMISGTWQ
jgi:lysophospholipase L1-like esterase